MPEKFEISQDLPGLNLPNALNFEANRLGTFANGSHPVSPISLAREGFFSTGNQDEVECFNCGQRHSGWKPGQVPSQIHRQISPNCSLVGDNAGRADAEAVLPNIPIPQRNSRPALFTGRAFRSFAPKLGIQEFGDGHNDFNVYRPLPFPGVTLRVQPDLRAIHNATALIPQQAYGTLPFTAWVDPGPQEPPLYPGYSSALQRQNSFQRFPEALRWLVEQLIHHGFFFVGHHDIVICFFCGLGIHRWGPGDDPRISHVRWSRSCGLLHEVERPSFIQSTLRELETIGTAS